LKARLFVLAAAVLWSTAGAAIKLTGLSGLQVSSGRSLVAAAVLLLLVPAARKRPSRKALWAALAYAATVTLFVIANKLTTAANAIFLQDAAPLYVMLLSPLLLGEKPSRSELTSAPIFLVGLALFFFDQLSPGQMLGNGVAILSGVAFALAIIGLRAVAEEGPVALAWGNLIAGLGVLPFAAPGFAPVANDWLVLGWLGVFQLAAAYLLFSRGVQQTPATEASLLILIEPVLSPVWTFLFAGERPGPWALAGGAVILAATLWRVAVASRLKGTQPA
jgi:drug/metabolite transporter, DME family